MASLQPLSQLVEAPRRLYKASDRHPYHQHSLIKTTTANRRHWSCQICSTRPVKIPQLLPYLNDPDEPDISYSCPHCRLDLCSRCYHGYLHPFHNHRLRRTRPELVYTSTEGQWRCDGCHTIHPPQDTIYHCQQCEVDLCELCFSGTLTHPLHSSHTLTPVNPAILYRTSLSWTCDHCNTTYNSTQNITYYHCHLCQFDLCESCFHGNKHHPLHVHPLEKTDPLYVYPQSEGLWQCDNCTLNNPGVNIRPLSPRAIMYHCSQCQYDLCEKCYSTPNQKSSYPPSNSHTYVFSTGHTHRPSTGNTHPSIGYTHPPSTGNTHPSIGYTHPLSIGYTHPGSTGYTHPPTGNTHPFDSYISKPSGPISYKLGSEGPLFTNITPKLCLVCSRRPATHTFIHSGRRCAGVGLVCVGCSEDLILDRRLCPYCRELPDRAEQIN